MTRDCDCEYLLSDARDYLALLLSHDAVSAELNQDYAYELLDNLTVRIGGDDDGS